MLLPLGRQFRISPANTRTPFSVSRDLAERKGDKFINGLANFLYQWIFSGEISSCNSRTHAKPVRTCGHFLTFTNVNFEIDEATRDRLST